MENLSKTLGVILGVIGVIIIVAILLAFPIQWLWNSFLVGAIDGVHTIGLGQAFAINVLTSILFKPTNTNNK